MSHFDAANRFEKIDRLFPGYSPQLNPHARITKKGHIVNVVFIQENRRGAANRVGVVVNIADVKPGEAETVFESPAGGRYSAKKNDGPAPVSFVVRDRFYKLIHVADHNLHLPGNSHANDRFPEHIGGCQIVNDNDAIRLDIGYPGFQYLTMHKTVINPDQGYVQR